MIIIDFETYSPVPIEQGSVKYALHPETDIICMALKVGSSATTIHGPDSPKYKALYNTTLFAHNALFEYLIWNFVGTPKYGFPHIPLEDWIDTQALANRYSYPGGLDKLCDVLETPVAKDKRGKALIKKICVSNEHGLRPKMGQDFTQKDLFDFYDYCKDDVDSTHEAVKRLPSSKLSDKERQYWVLTQEMNLQGLPVDTEAIQKIYHYNQSYIEEMTHRIPEITGGVVQKATQTARIKDFVNSQGYDMPNLQAPTVDEMLERDDLTPKVEEILTLRQGLGQTSTAKYAKLKDMVVNDRIYNNLHYWGAGPGRWAGRSFQMHNLPRAKVDNPEEMIEKFKNFEPIENPIRISKALIRPMICAPEGRVLLVADYKSIENYLLVWQASDWKALNLLRDGGDQYIDMASFIYGVRPEDVTDAQRFIGKVIILGCGFGMGAGRLQTELSMAGVQVTLALAQDYITAYREKYFLVKKMWYAMLRCAVSAIQFPGRTFEYNGCLFRVVKDRAGTRWLVLTLSSGRNIYYCKPKVEDGEYGASIVHMGINPYNKKWSRRHLIPGRLTENIVQGTARDCMAEGLMNVKENMPYVDLLGQVHDEGLAEAPEENAEEQLQEFIKQLCTMPEWAKDLPLKAEGYYAKRYRKD